MFGNFKPTEIIIVVVILVLLFGSKKLPDAARSIGRSMRIFRTEVKAMSEDGRKDESGAPKPDQQ